MHRTFAVSLVALALMACSAEATEKQANATSEVRIPTGNEPKPVQPALRCELGSTWDVRLYPTLPKAWVDGMENALRTWSKALGGSFKYTVRVTGETDWLSGACRLSVFPATGDAFEGSSSPWAAFDGDLNAGTHLTAAGGIWANTDNVDYPTAYAASLHELGHFFGLEHTADVQLKSVMWKFITIPGRLGCEDQAKACELWGCDPACAGKDEWLGDR